jgi:hypothetical protein
MAAEFDYSRFGPLTNDKLRLLTGILPYEDPILSSSIIPSLSYPDTALAV